MRHINQLDLFSGIGGFHLGFEKAGYKVTSFFSEIDKHAIAVYQHQFKDSKYVGSVTDVRGADLPSIDLITFGSPCQDFSLAGKRAGMEGQRSSLIFEAIRLIHECRPRVFVWENVKGTFSSNNGADFWAIIQAFANIGGYRLEWQLLNTSWVLPQNRERIYLVGYSTAPAGDWRGVFPITADGGQTDELQGHNPRANTITTRYTGNANGLFIGEHQQPAQVIDKRGNLKRNDQASTLVAGYHKLPSDADYIRIKTANQQGYQEAEAGDAVRLYQPGSETQRGRVGKGIAHTLETTGQQGVVQPVTHGTLTEAIGRGGSSSEYLKSVRDVNTAQPSWRMRRLTPIECERLQGFPDDHTAFGLYDGEVKPMSNTQRYKQCGNAVTVDIVSLVAERLKPIFDA